VRVNVPAPITPSRPTELVVVWLAVVLVVVVGLALVVVVVMGLAVVLVVVLVVVVVGCGMLPAI
jgi:hypothetical protein